MEQCLNLALRKANRVMTQMYDDHLSSLGLRIGQFSILRVLHFSQPTNNKALQDILVLDQTTLTRNLKPLIRDGLVGVSPSAADGRIKELALTPEGEALYEEALPLWRKAQKQMQQGLGDGHVSELLSVTDAIVGLK